MFLFIVFHALLVAFLFLELPRALLRTVTSLPYPPYDYLAPREGKFFYAEI
jgi:hypothetical protein